TYVFTYKDCSGHSHDWSYIYTIAQPDFTLPASGDSTVNCPADAVRPTAPVVKDACGNILTPTVSEPTLISCDGNMTYVFTYKDCSGHSHDWSYIYTIAQPDFTLPASGDSTVNCPADAVQPTAPVVKDACGNILVPTITEPSLVSCDGNMTYVFNYKDCSGHSHDWSYVYTIAQPDFMIPTNGSSTVNCIEKTSQPIPPIIKDGCGNNLSPKLIQVVDSIDSGKMNLMRIFVYQYTSCNGHIEYWKYLYKIRNISTPQVNVTEPTCQVATGTITISKVAGMRYSINGSVFDTISVYTNLLPDNYSVRAMNSDSCISNDTTVTIHVQPATPAVPKVMTIQPTCQIATGTITIAKVAGMSYSINGSAFDTISVYANLLPGNYSVRAMNSDSCISNDTTVTIHVQLATPAVPKVTTIQPTCQVATGTITIAKVTGMSYSINGSAFDTISVYANLLPGNYSVRAMNADSCMSNDTTVAIHVQPATPAEPKVTTIQPTCQTATGTIMIAKVTGLRYSINSSAFDTISVYANLLPGNYSVRAMNADSCISNDTTVTIHVQLATPAVPKVTTIQPTCQTATGTITIAKVAGISYSINGSAFDTISVYANLLPGNYSVRAMNADSCISNDTTVTIHVQPATPAVPNVMTIQPTCQVATGTITIAKVAGMRYSINGSAFDTISVYANLLPGNYSVRAMNSDSCISNDTTVTIHVQPATPKAPQVKTIQPTCQVATGTIIIAKVAGMSYSINGSAFDTISVYANLLPGNYSLRAMNSDSCISTDTTVTIHAQPATPAVPKVTATQSTCQAATGTITITKVTGMRYSINGSAFDTISVYANLLPGNYSVRAMNADSCISNDTTVTIHVQPATPAVPKVTTIQPTCQIATGTITIAKVAGMRYSINGSAFDTISVYANLLPGNYSVRAMNADSCISNDTTVTIHVQPATPAVPKVTTIQPTCQIATGTITIAKVAGMRYSINGSAFDTISVYANLLPGNYSLRAMNADSCISNDTTVTIHVQPATPVVPKVTTIQPTCQTATGTITISKVAGMRYSINGSVFDTISVYTNLLPGNYSVRAMNADSCISNDTTVTINVQPATPAAPKVTTIQPTCQVATGTITIAKVAGMSYSINGSAFDTISVYANLLPDTYSVRAMNADSCISNDTTVTIHVQPATPAVPKVTTIQPTCQIATGTITIAKVAGMSYSINGSAFDTISVYANLLPGNYSVRAMNSDSCISNDTTLTIHVQPATPAAPKVTAMQPTCQVSTGTISIAKVTGMRYSVNGSAFDSTTVYANLLPGNYSVRAMNSDSCISNDTTVTIHVQPATPAVPKVTTIQPTCQVATGTITIAKVTGLRYSVNGSAFDSTTVYANLLPGNYSVRAMNSDSCISNDTTVTIHVQPATPAAPKVTATQPTCQTATGTIVIAKVTGLRYSVNGSVFDTISVYANLLPGNYSVRAMNSDSCISNDTTVTIHVQPATPAVPKVTTIQPTCQTATGTIMIAKVTGLRYSINGSAFDTISVYANLLPGTYSVRAMNSDSCISNDTTLTIHVQPATPKAPQVKTIQPTCQVATGTITISKVAGMSYSINGSAFDTISVYANLLPGNYSVRAMNSDSCISNDTTVTIHVQPATPKAPQVKTIQPTCQVATGTITIAKVAGMSYSINGSVFDTISVYANLLPGNYSVRAMNADSCISNDTTVTIHVQPATPSVPKVTATQPTCQAATGTITIVKVTGLRYSINGSAFDTTAIYANLLPGNYNVRAMNADSCISNDTTVTLHVQPATPKAPQVKTIQPTCQVATGTITIAKVAGMRCSINGSVFDTISVYANLLPGNYSVRAMNSDSCISNDTTVTIHVQPATPAVPKVTTIQPTCQVATGTITIAKVAGMSYSINGSVFDTISVYANLLPGNYSVRGMNADSCISNDTTVMIHVQPATPAVPKVTTIQPTCQVATGTITIAKVTGLRYSINGSVFDTISVYANLLPGNYSVRAMNSDSCISNDTTVTIHVQPATPAAPKVTTIQPTCQTATGTITISKVAGMRYSINGSAFDTISVYANLLPDIYSVRAMNSDSCISNDTTVTIHVQP
ncbi:hypothetical protein, partial [Parabacteroides sp. FAFU027]|uniref:HYR-like domain-containing protein n=1 Tax=Parabacteroides sp. FAFU027 TaxID=2922715 RepID=UPI001FB030AB